MLNFNLKTKKTKSYYHLNAVIFIFLNKKLVKKLKIQFFVCVELVFCLFFFAY